MLGKTLGPVRKLKLYVGDVHDHHLQPSLLHDVADYTVAPIDTDNIANCLNGNRVFIINNCGWTDK